MLQLQTISKTYSDSWNKYEVLKDLNLEVSKGEFISLYGKSGSGKTTLLNIIGLLDSYSGGTYTIDGKDVSSYSKAKIPELRNQMFGFIFQAYHLIYEMNVLENVCMPLGYRGLKKNEREGLANQLLEEFGLVNLVKKYPSQLSGGERQRVAIARAMVGSPKIILADEPTGNLDQKSGKIIMDKLCEINRKGTTIIMATHDTSLAKYSSRVVEVAEGRLNII